MLLAAEGLGNNEEVSPRTTLETLEPATKIKVILKIKDIYLEGGSLIVTVQSGKMTLVVLNRENLVHRICDMGHGISR